jgi:hypothetical protein
MKNTPKGTDVKNTGSQSSPKTNQDFNKKQPKPNDAEIKSKPENSIQDDEHDLLQDETSDPGDVDGNGNLIGEYDDIEIGYGDDNKPNDDVDPAPATDTRRNTKNPDAREL